MQCDASGCIVDLTIQLAIIMIGKQIISNVKQIIIPYVFLPYSALSDYTEFFSYITSVLLITILQPLDFDRLCMEQTGYSYRLTKNDQIWHGNTRGEKHVSRGSASPILGATYPKFLGLIQAGTQYEK